MLAARMNTPIEAMLRTSCTGPHAATIFARPRPPAGGPAALGTCRSLDEVGAVLKAPSRDADGTLEKGVLLLKNNDRIEWFRRSVDAPQLLEDYVVVLEPSWSSYASPEILAWTAYAPHDVVVMAPAEADRKFLERLATNLVPIPLGAGDWVDPGLFRPVGRTNRPYGAVAVARLCITKRLDLLFRAIKRLGDPAFRVAILVPKGSSPDRQEILDSVRRRGLAARIDLFERLGPHEVNDVYNDSKVNVLLSRQEGANRSLFEGFFAGTPGLITAGHLSAPLDRFVAETGRVVEEAELPSALAHFRDHWADYAPRRWALENIAADVSSRRLEQVLERLALARGEPWTRGIVAKCNAPEPTPYPRRSPPGWPESLDSLLERYPRREHA